MSDPFAVSAPAQSPVPGTVRPLSALGVLAGGFVGIAALLSAVTTGLNWQTYQLVGDYVAGKVTLADLEAHDRLVSAVNWTSIAVGLAAVVVFLCWLWRARANTAILSMAEHRLARGWVIGAWVCPVVSFWYPAMVVTDIWKTSRPGPEQTLDLSRRKGSPLITWWWIAFLVSLLLGRVVSFMLRDPKTLDELRDGATVGTLATLLRISAAVLLVLIVRRVTRWQQRDLALT